MGQSAADAARIGLIPFFLYTAKFYLLFMVKQTKIPIKFWRLILCIQFTLLLYVLGFTAVSASVGLVNIARLPITQMWASTANMAPIESPTRGIKNAFDTNLTSSWVTGGKSPHWIIMRFEVPVEVSEIRVHTPLNPKSEIQPRGPSEMSIKFEIASLNDNSNSNPRYHVIENIQLTPPKTQHALLRSIKNVRGIQMYFEGRYASIIKEVEVLGKAPKDITAGKLVGPTLDPRLAKSMPPTKDPSDDYNIPKDRFRRIGTIRSEGAELKTAPAPDAEVITLLQPDSDVQILKSPKFAFSPKNPYGRLQWYEVDYKGRQGWVYRRDITEYIGRPGIIIVPETNLRTAPSLDATLIARLAAGKEVWILKYPYFMWDPNDPHGEDEWYKVISLDDKAGFVYRRNLLPGMRTDEDRKRYVRYYLPSPDGEKVILRNPLQGDIHDGFGELVDVWLVNQDWSSVVSLEKATYAAYGDCHTGTYLWTFSDRYLLHVPESKLPKIEFLDPQTGEKQKDIEGFCPVVDISKKYFFYCKMGRLDNQTGYRDIQLRKYSLSTDEDQPIYQWHGDLFEGQGDYVRRCVGKITLDSLDILIQGKPTEGIFGARITLDFNGNLLKRKIFDQP